MKRIGYIYLVLCSWGYVSAHDAVPASSIPGSNQARLQIDLADSISVRANPAFNRVGAFHKMLFGENYRKEWDAETNVPVIRISEFRGGLKPLKRGGGFQSYTLRLADSTGKEWVIRSVNKTSVRLLPQELHHTLAEYIVDDANSAQHPYSALMVPPIAHAAGVPHTQPVIGMIAPDSALDMHNLLFANMLCLLEEREPEGNSDNTIEMLRKVNRDNDHTYDARTFFRARMLDLLLGDWDRHGDQWRWRDESDDGDADYLVVPRDRDQVLRLTQGVVPTLASTPFTLPDLRGLQGFGPKIGNASLSLYKSRFLNAHPETQFSYAEWMEMANDFVRCITDSVLMEGIDRLPHSAYTLRHTEILNDLKKRRDALPEAMSDYYRFINRIVDIKASDKHEHIVVQRTAENALRVTMHKINKEGGMKRKLMDKTYDLALTSEIRIYLGDGQDSVFIDTRGTPIRLRVIGQGGQKHYHIVGSQKRTAIYGVGKKTTFSGNTIGLKTYRRKKGEDIPFKPVDLYNVWMPLVSAGYNVDDGFLLGGGFRYTHNEGFLKSPFAHTQQLLVSAAFATGAFSINYKGRWTDVLGRADLVVQGQVLAPNNTQNFFGLGNATVYDRDAHNIRYHRARFTLVEAYPSLQWKLTKSATVGIGPIGQFYHADRSGNAGRFISDSGALHTYDSLTIDKNKLFSGIKVTYSKDTRNNRILTTSGGSVNFELQGMHGLNRYSRSFVQAKAEVAFYRSLARDAIVLANRTGGGVTFGKTAFYQSLFLGGQGNLLGSRQYRFAGEQLLFNNFEARIRIAEVRGYLAPGQLGITWFYDTGKVWAAGHNSKRMHQGVGGGIYYAPAKAMLVQLMAGYSREGWYPHFTMGARF